MSELTTLQPTLLWDIFSKICSIPHPSYHEHALADFIIELAQQHNVHVERDETGNILLSKPATNGMEHKPSIVLQAHLDMVPQKNDATKHDFLTDAINPYIDGEWVKARGTTLGADNGIGMASALAILFDKNIKHGPLEVLLTMTEEAGMEGAFGLKPNWIKSQLLINTDSEEEGEICIGCAGGVNFETTLPINWQPCDSQLMAIDIALTGLKGGHSGADIHLGRGNANKLLARFLAQYNYLNFRIVKLRGGSLRNAIPREAYVTLVVNPKHHAELHQASQEFLLLLQKEFGQSEPDLTLTITTVQLPTQQLTAESNKTIIHWLNSAPNGVISFSHQLPDVVESSLNLGVMLLSEQHLSLTFLVRSLQEGGKHGVVSLLTSHSQLVNAQFNINNDYPGWTPDTSSSLLKTVVDNYQRLFDNAPKTMVIHAGLECGLFKKSYPKMDMISFGPTIVSPHSPDERVHIKSVLRYWQLLIATIKHI